MRVLNESVLAKAARKNAPRRKALTIWLATTRAAHWHGIHDVHATFPAADAIPVWIKGEGNVTVTCFDIKGNEYRLLACVDYSNGLVSIIELMTHGDYSKGFWKERL